MNIFNWIRKIPNTDRTEEEMISHFEAIRLIMKESFISEIEAIKIINQSINEKQPVVFGLEEPTSFLIHLEDVKIH